MECWLARWLLTYLFQKLVAMWPFVNVIEDRDLGTNYLTPTSVDRLLQLHFNHMTSSVAATFCHAVD